METLEKKISHKDNIDTSDYSLDISNNDERILCNHCFRTTSNGIRCMGICVADNDY